MGRNTWTRFWTNRDISSNPSTPTSQERLGSLSQKRVLGRNHTLPKKIPVTTQTKRRKRTDKMLRRWVPARMKTREGARKGRWLFSMVLAPPLLQRQISTWSNRLFILGIPHRTTSASSPLPLPPLMAWTSKISSDSATQWAMGSKWTLGIRTPKISWCPNLLPQNTLLNHQSQTTANRTLCLPAHPHLHWRMR